VKQSWNEKLTPFILCVKLWPLSTFEKIIMNVNIGHFQAPLNRPEKLWIDLSNFKSILYNLVCKLTLIYKFSVHEFGWNRNENKAYFVSLQHALIAWFSPSLAPFSWPNLARYLAFRLNLAVHPFLNLLIGNLNPRWWRICPQIRDKGRLSRSKHSDYICGFCRRCTDQNFFNRIHLGS